MLLIALTLASFFTPAKCAFPDGKESMDGGHVAFVCYVMQRVEHDQHMSDASQNFAYLARKQAKASKKDVKLQQTSAKFRKASKKKEAGPADKTFEVLNAAGYQGRLSPAPMPEASGAVGDA